MHKHQEVLSIQCFACHGMIENSQQVVLTNNYDPKRQFYEFIDVEGTIRYYAPKMERVYFIILFACCRELYDSRAKRGEGVPRDMTQKDFELCAVRHL